MKQEETFNATVNDNQVLKDLRPDELDFVRVGPEEFHILLGNVSYAARLLQANYVRKSFTFRINGSTYEVKLADRFDQLVAKMGMKAGPAQRVKEIKAPMPGLVLSLQVTTGQEVSKGDPLLILEAMKMENVLKAPGSGTVKKINVIQGQAVDKNQLLLEFE